MTMTQITKIVIMIISLACGASAQVVKLPG